MKGLFQLVRKALKLKGRCAKMNEQTLHNRGNIED